ncbi:MAG: VWA domain-containing protein, partial [Planctomycetes bacterium]|nr:VWA domain-containing protein [Planctomycetota bacterium]
MVVAQGIEEMEIPVGREVAVADSERGSEGAFMAIGAGQGAKGMFGNRGEGQSVSVRRAFIGDPYADRKRVDRVVADPHSGGETYVHPTDNGFLQPSSTPLSTFGLDVDTASYSNVRRFIANGQLPPADAVRVEELINYFDYAYPAPKDDHTLAVQVDVSACPWRPENRLARIGVRAAASAEPPPANLVFLVDVSGSMGGDQRLPLVKSALALLVERLTENDRVAIVTYACGSGVALASTSGADKRAILLAIDRLTAGGSTNGASGIVDAYSVAREGFIRGGANRVILCTDGDFNVGVTDRGALKDLIVRERESKVFLSVLGFGMGNLKDATMETLADAGNGNYAYIDTLVEARRVLVERMRQTLVTVAKDAKIQVEFNPRRVAAYRLIGYENRLLAKEDFADDRKDAGEVGDGHAVTALYEIVPAGGAVPGADPALRYQPVPPAVATDPAVSDELMTVKVRYQAPEGSVSRLIEHPVRDTDATPARDHAFATAVAAFGLRLRGASELDGFAWDRIVALAE